VFFYAQNGLFPTLEAWKIDFSAGFPPVWRMTKLMADAESKPESGTANRFLPDATAPARDR
jgi:hypothetical protein